MKELVIKLLIRKLICCKFIVCLFSGCVSCAHVLLMAPVWGGQMATQGISQHSSYKTFCPHVLEKMGPNLYCTQRSVLSASTVIPLDLKLVCCKIKDYLNSGLYQVFIAKK